MLVWDDIRNYRPEDFSQPASLDHGVLFGLDRLAQRLGRAVILCDYRPWNTGIFSQHCLGRAVDFAYPGVSPSTVYDALRSVNVFSGIGVYRNAAGVASFHVDTRTDRTPADPALWGGVKNSKEQLDWSYGALETVLSMFDRNSSHLGFVGLALVSLVWLFRSK